MNRYKMLMFDLDGTLLTSEKKLSERTLQVLKNYKEYGFKIGVSTSRSETNSMTFLLELKPDVLISSGGALVKNGLEYIYTAEYSVLETRRMIELTREVCGDDCEITMDTITNHYWNYKVDPKTLDQSWGDSIYTDYSGFDMPVLKMCVEILEPNNAKRLMKKLPECDCIRFSDGDWYKFTKKGVTKENAILKVCNACGFSTEEIIAFGDDYADIGMLELCGLGVAMGNAIEKVKNRADIIIGTNDEDGIADFLENMDGIV